ncbi:MAG: archaellin/type IV pilin N-terminal domain-containing protein [Haloferacaceae archaeon]
MIHDKVQSARDRLPESGEHGQVGIGTLIVFIAMVLVAAIAAGVLINTAGFLQSQASQTGEESSAQVTNQVQVVSANGLVSADKLKINNSSDTVYIRDGGSFEVLSTTPADTTATLQDGDGNSIDVNPGDIVNMTDINNGDSEFTLQNGAGNSVTFNGSSPQFNASTTANFTIESVDSGNTFEITNETVTSGSGAISIESVDTPKVKSVNIIVTQAPGASDMDMAKATINFIAPDGTHNLVYSSGPHPKEDSQFTLTKVQDDDNTIPVMTSGDRFTIHIDPGYLNAGTTSTVKITTPSGATKSMLIRVPDSLANQEAVGL